MFFYEEKTKEFGKIQKVKEWLVNKDEVDRVEKQVRKIIDDTFFQAITGMKEKKVLNTSEVRDMIKNEIDDFLVKKHR